MVTGESSTALVLLECSLEHTKSGYFSICHPDLNKKYKEKPLANMFFKLKGICLHCAPPRVGIVIWFFQPATQWFVHELWVVLWFTSRCGFSGCLSQIPERSFFSGFYSSVASYSELFLYPRRDRFDNQLLHPVKQGLEKPSPLNVFLAFRVNGSDSFVWGFNYYWSGGCFGFLCFHLIIICFRWLLLYNTKNENRKVIVLAKHVRTQPCAIWAVHWMS